MDGPEQQLIRYFRLLDTADRATLFAFAEFLASLEKKNATDLKVSEILDFLEEQLR